MQAASTGLVAAYSFNEGSGTTAVDSSGNGNNGSISGATWTTAGKYGNALSFNGRSSRVIINDSPSLHLSSGMTLEAWVSSTSVPNSWQDVIYKENDIYFLEAGSGVSNHPPAVGAMFQSNGDQFLAGTSALKSNTWTHLAATFDGATLTLYVNGVESASLSLPDSLTSSTQALQIGGDAAFGQYFKGIIDEVRIYNRALAPAEIQADMTNPISQSVDAQPPTSPSNVSGTANGPTSINLSWTASTDNVGITSYLLERCTGSGCASFAQIATSTTTTYSNTGLSASASYSYRVRATDAAGNLSAYSNVATVATPAAPDTTSPSAPTNLAATPVSTSQINLSWTASTDNVGVTGYLLERCLGSGCTTFSQIVTPSGTIYSDTGLTASTSYSYRVRATDAAGNLSGYSNFVTIATPAAPDMTSPSAPTNLAATPISTSQINLSWKASTDNVGVTSYLLERCTGSGCASFAQIATSTTTTYSNTGLSASTTYSYRVRATDAAGNLSAYSNIASAATPAAPQSQPIAYVQSNYATPQSNQSTVSVTYSAAQAAGDLNVSVVGWNDTAATVASVSDSSGNAYALAVGPTQVSGTLTQSIYYAKNISGAAANSNVVTVKFNGSAASADIRILEYSGLDRVSPFDVASSATGNSSSSASASSTTTNANDLLLGANIVVNLTTGPGSGFTKRILTSPDGDIVEDRTVSATGSYSASATLSSSAAWIMQLVAFKAAGAGAPPPPPISVSVSPLNAPVVTAQSQPFTAAVQNDSLNGGVKWTLSGAGCTGPACGTLSNSTTTSVTYIAPASVPNPPAVALLATSATDSTKSALASITVTPQASTISVTISPRRASVTLTQPQQFSANVTGDSQNLGVTWTVDGNASGSNSIGTITTTGLFTPGTQTGLHTISAVSVASASASASASLAVTDLIGVFMHHNDVQRTGQNLKEYALTPSTVSSTNFGTLFNCSVNEGGSVPGYTYAQPLYVANITMADGNKHNVVYVATESDFVYAFDADANPCQQRWKASMLTAAHGAAAGATTVPAGDTGETGDLVPEIGITSTPVIDPTTNTIYVCSKTKEPGPAYVHRLHALDLTTGLEKFGGPATISASGFDPLAHMQRPALLLNNGTVYLSFGSHGDRNTYHGWVMAYNASTLAQTFVWASTDLSSNTEGALWGSGTGPAADPSGNIWVETANGNFDGTINFGDSVVKLSPAGSVLDFFTPSYQDSLRANDVDLGSGGVTILPDSVGSAAHPHLALATGKPGGFYLLDQTNLGQFNSSSDNDVQEVFPQGLNTSTIGGGIFGKIAYWNGNVYSVLIGDSLRQYSIASGTISASSVSSSTQTFPYPAAIPTVSANGSSAGIVWIIEVGSYSPSKPAILRAFDATNVATQLFASPSTGVAGIAVKYSVPTVANGKVYVGGQGQLSVFGLLP